MSHIVTVRTEVRDANAVRTACKRLNLAAPVFGEARLFSGSKTGWQVKLPDWRYPVVIDINTGQLDFDNYNQRWGKQQQLDKFLQAYAVERSKFEARRKGYSCTEKQLADGSIKLSIQVGNGGAI